MSTQTARPTSADSAKRRTQSLAGALTGVAIVAILAVVFFAVKNSDSDNSPSAGPAQGAPTAAAPEPSAADTAAQPPAGASPAAVDTPAALAKEPEVTAGKGTLTKLVITPIVPGTGPVVQKGQTVTANYKLVSYKTGEVIDSSWSRGEPFSTQVGVGAVIQGWDQGIPGQKVGSRFQLDVPAALAYGDQQGDLRFVVDILAAK